MISETLRLWMEELCSALSLFRGMDTYLQQRAVTTSSALECPSSTCPARIQYVKKPGIRKRGEDRAEAAGQDTTVRVSHRGL